MRAFFVGVIGFLLIQGWWGWHHVRSTGEREWVLEPRRGIVFCVTAVFLLAAVAVGLRSRDTRWLKGAALAVSGIGTGLVIALLAVGPGTIWPIVVAIDFTILAPSVIVGSAVGELLYAARQR